ncbi:MAG: restriction endonuclease subunit S [Azoarcus sp.]|nr:restriction endonuclease subunit S [Azoarcus sp.]
MVTKISDCLEPSKERTVPSQSPYHKCVELEHIESNSGRISGYSETENVISLKSVFYKGDILFGKLRPYLRKYALADFDGLCTTEIWVLRGKCGVDNSYMFYQLQSDWFISLANNTTGTKMPRADWNIVKEAEINLPPLPEQRLIAEALSDTDALLAALEKLIAKKRAIKQGAMQELLTGKRRLPGFEGEWVEKPLSEIMRIRKERINPFNYISTRCIELEHIEPISGYLLGWVDSRNQRSLKTLFHSDDVLFCKLRPYLRKFYFSTFSGVCSTEFWVFTSINDTVANQFIYHLVQMYKFLEIANSTTGTKMPRADWTLMKDTVFALPSNVAEQTAIASILSDMDAEIDALTAKRNKLRDIKQGMMSELLTGRIRLVGREDTLPLSTRPAT